MSSTIENQVLSLGSGKISEAGVIVDNSVCQVNSDGNGNQDTLSSKNRTDELPNKTQEEIHAEPTPKQSLPEPCLGGEAPLLDVETEKTSVLQMLKALDEDQLDYMLNVLKDPSMPIRHFRAEKGNLDVAIKKLRAALQWRQEFGVHRIIHASPDNQDDDMYSILCRENETGKIYVRGYDRQGRALMYMRPALENTHDATNNMRHLVWNLEKAIACTRRKSVELGSPAPLEKINLVIDYHGFRLQHSPPMSTSRWTLDILQKHYPECMYRAFVVNPPFVFRSFWTLIKPFIDTTTKQKVIFCTGRHGTANLVEHIEHVNKLESVVGGTTKVPDFNSEQYVHLPFAVSFDE